MRRIGFTLDLEGPDEHLRRVASAAFAEMEKIAREQHPEPHGIFSGLYDEFRYLPTPLTVKGTYTVREAIA